MDPVEVAEEGGKHGAGEVASPIAEHADRHPRVSPVGRATRPICP
jgi:hypothetical protein